MGKLANSISFITEIQLWTITWLPLSESHFNLVALFHLINFFSFFVNVSHAIVF
jgi:hypothetical protein